MHLKFFNKKVFSRNFILFTTGEFVSLVGSSMSGIVMLWWLLKKGSILNLAGFVTVQAITQILTSIFAVNFVNRFNKKKIMVLCDFINSIILLFFAYLMFKNRLTILILYFIAIFGSIVDVVFKISSSVMGYTLLDNEAFSKGQSLREFLKNLAQIIGPALAGLLLGFFSFWFIFLLDGITYFLSAIQEIFIQYEEEIIRNKGDKISLKKSIQEFFKEIIDGYRFVFQSGIILLFSIIMIRVLITTPFFSIILPKFVVEILKKTAIEYGYLSSILSAGSMVIAFVLTFVALKKSEVILVMALMIETIIFFTFSFISNFLTAAITIFIFGSMISLIGITLSKYIKEIVPKEHLARVNSMNTFVNASTPLGFMVTGILLKFTEMSKVFIIFGFISLIGIGIAIVFIKGQSENRKIKQKDVIVNKGEIS